MLSKRIVLDNHHAEAVEAWEDDLFMLAYALTDSRNEAIELMDHILDQQSTHYMAYDREMQLGIYQALCRRWLVLMKNVEAKTEVMINACTHFNDADIRQYVRQLPTCQKLVIILVDIACLTYQEVAQVIDADEKKVRSWLTSARQYIMAQRNRQTSH